jgi:putative SOS response-associated peptidase YedK
MPLILAPGAWETWLDPTLEDVAELRGLLVPSPAADLEAYPVSTLVNSTRNEGAALIERSAGEVLTA